MPIAMKIRFIISAVWVLAVFVLCGLYVTDEYNDWFFPFMGMFLLWSSPAGIYWACIWLWGKVPVPHIGKLPSIPQKYSRRLLHVVASVTMVQMVQVFHLTNQINNSDIAVFLTAMINVVALTFGWGLSVILVKRITAPHQRKVLVATYMVMFLSAAILNAIASDMSKERAVNQLQSDKTAQDISGMIWDNLSPEDKEMLQRNTENPYSAAAEALARELEKEKRQKAYPGLMKHE